MTKQDNAMLTEIPAPQHRPLYPGELSVFLGGGRHGGAGPWRPMGLDILLQHADYTKGTKTVETMGKWELVVKAGEPVMLASRDGSIAVADLNLFVGLPLAAEFASIAEKLRATFDPSVGHVRQTVQFKNPAQFNDLIVGLAWHHLGISRQETLTRLLADMDRDVPPQETWYRKHEPRLDDLDAWAPYAAEVTGFSTLVGEYRRVTRAQLAADGNGEGTR